MSRYSIAEAEVRFAELARRAAAGEDVLIASGGGTLIRLVPVTEAQTAAPRRPGSGKGELLWMAPDFDATPEDFGDYT